MTPNLIMSLDIEPITLMWNGQAVSLPGTYELVPDEMVKHLHKRVMAIALHERRRVPLYGRAALPSNGRRDDEIAELVNRAYEGKKHIHGNPIKKEKEVEENV
jgi:hypothetical protein